MEQHGGSPFKAFATVKSKRWSKRMAGVECLRLVYLRVRKPKPWKSMVVRKGDSIEKNGEGRNKLLVVDVLKHASEA